MQTVYYDPNKCMSIRARHQNIQCCYDKKVNSDYCGIHTRSQHIVRIDSILGAQPMVAAPEAAPVAAPVAEEDLMGGARDFSAMSQKLCRKGAPELTRQCTNTTKT